MALSANTVMEVRNGGADTNGGGFVTGAAGTDFSLQDAAQKSGADLTMHATDNTKVLPVAAGVAATDVGNLIQITAGTSWTQGFYQITAQDGTYWTLDRSPSAAANVNLATYAMGGALASPGKAWSTLSVNGQTCFIKYHATPYSITSTSSNVAGGRVTVTSGTTFYFVGYDSTRTIGNTDANRPTLLAVGISGVALVTLAGATRNYVRQIICDGDGLGTMTGFSIASGGIIHNCKAVDCVTGFTGTSTGTCSECYADTCTTGFTLGIHCFNCVAKAGTTGFNGCTTTFCIANDQSGVGFAVSVNQAYSCVSYSCGSHGFSVGNGGLIQSSISYGNTGAGYSAAAGAILRNCAAGSNTGGATTGSPIEITSLVALTADPFIDAPNGNFALNRASGGGALCRGVGYPGLFPDGLSTGYLAIGAVEPKAAAPHASYNLGL